MINNINKLHNSVFLILPKLLFHNRQEVKQCLPSIEREGNVRILHKNDLLLKDPLHHIAFSSIFETTMRIRKKKSTGGKYEKRIGKVKMMKRRRRKRNKRIGKVKIRN